MIDEFFAMMKVEIKTTCDQARAIRQESVLRDAQEKKLINVVMAQEEYITQMRDKAMTWNVEALKQLADVTPLSGGGVFSHGFTRLY
jgi:hypothetical protein